jgi:hypothetical protein
MDYAFFESMSKEEADNFLNGYLKLEKEAWSVVRDEAKKHGINADFSANSITPVFQWLMNQIGVIDCELDKSLPDWITQSSSYLRGLFEFDEHSKILIIRASYYLGAAFIDEFNQLSWTTGKIDTAVQNMPVVKGFEHELELSTIMVTENLFSRVAAGEADSSAIDIAVKYWRSQVE